MIPPLRKLYNEDFTQAKYQAFIKDMANLYPGQLDFRIAETPVFVPAEFTRQALQACESIIDVITDSTYHKHSEKAIPEHLRVPNEDGHPHFIAFDFGICYNDKGELEPQLIEMQGFPSLFAFQAMLPRIHARHLWQPDGYCNYLNGFTEETYVELLHKIIVADEDPEHVVLLEIFPKQQKTRIDFFCTESFLGIKTICLTELIQEGRNLYYLNNGRKTPIRRIFNRLIFDDLFQQSPEVQEQGRIFQQDLDVVWVPHPNWFYRISKFTLPFVYHPNVPQTYFLNEVAQVPHDLENFVVKPLFSFAGQGVIIDVTPEAIESITDPQNWILQRKVNYAAIIQTPDEPAKAELRLFYFWEPGAPRPIATNNLTRMSKGKMVGVRYNKDKEWVGGTFSLFEQER